MPLTTQHFRKTSYFLSLLVINLKNKLKYNNIHFEIHIQNQNIIRRISIYKNEKTNIGRVAYKLYLSIFSFFVLSSGP